MHSPEAILIENCTFKNNTVVSDIELDPMSGKGAAMNYLCKSKYFYCSAYIINNNLFQDNFAINAGGAINWEEVEPHFDSSNIFLNNYAGHYGNDIASFAQKIISITEEQYYNAINIPASGFSQSRRNL